MALSPHNTTAHFDPGSEHQPRDPIRSHTFFGGLRKAKDSLHHHNFLGRATTMAQAGLGSHLSGPIPTPRQQSWPLQSIPRGRWRKLMSFPGQNGQRVPSLTFHRPRMWSIMSTFISRGWSLDPKLPLHQCKTSVFKATISRNHHMPLCMLESNCITGLVLLYLRLRMALAIP